MNYTPLKELQKKKPAEIQVTVSGKPQFSRFSIEKFPTRLKMITYINVVRFLLLFDESESIIDVKCEHFVRFSSVG